MEKTTRPDWDTYFLEIATKAATRATCLRRKVGAVIVRDHGILTTGYNGSPPKLPHCIDPGVGCYMENGHCLRCIHAEENAFLMAAYNGVRLAGSTLYCTDHPCYACSKAALRVGVEKIVYVRDYDDGYNKIIISESGIQVLHLPEAVTF